MHRQIFRIITGIGSAAALAVLAGCSHMVAGNPTFGSGAPVPDAPLVKFDALPSLMVTPAEAGAVMNAPELATVATGGTMDHLPDGWLSEPRCAGAIIPAEESTYRGSGYLGVHGEVAKDPYQRVISEGVVVFGAAREAQGLVGTAVSRWRDCTGQTLTVNLEGPPVNWIASEPITSNGAAVLLRRQEGGHGYACARAMADGSNIVADVLVCGPDEAVLNDQAATIVNMILAKIPR